MIMGVIEMMAEAMTLGEKAGIQSEKVYEFIEGMCTAHQTLSA